VSCNSLTQYLGLHVCHNGIRQRPAYGATVLHVDEGRHVHEAFAILKRKEIYA
jgi:hypothetical protein